MKVSLAPRLLSATAFGLAVILLSASPAAEAETLILPAGVACDGFDLRIDSTGGRRIERTFKDTNNKPVRTLSAGTGGQVTFTNAQTGATLSLKSNGSVTQTTTQDVNDFIVVTTGHLVLILFPTDVPAGPTTTLYVGRVVYRTDSAMNFTLLGTTGKATDICALLAS